MHSARLLQNVLGVLRCLCLSCDLFVCQRNKQVFKTLLVTCLNFACLDIGSSGNCRCIHLERAERPKRRLGHPSASSNTRKIFRLVRMVPELAAQVAVVPENSSSSQAYTRAVEQLRTLLRSISGSASRIQEDRHEALLRALFKLSLWRVPREVQDPLADLLVHLTWVRIGLQDACIQFLVSNFCPPFAPRVAPQGSPPSAREPHSPSPEELSAHSCALNTLNKVITQHPLSTRLVNDAIDQHFPHRCQPRERLCPYVRAMLQLAGVLRIAVASSLSSSMCRRLRHKCICVSYSWLLPSSTVPSMNM